MKRLVKTGLVAVVMLVLALIVRQRIPRLMEHMMETVMPKMMGSCFAQMDFDRRRFMLAHCRSMLDQMEEKYVTAEAA